MDIYKNKSTGRYFIFINETGNEEALFVTPNAEIKSLKLEIFNDEQEEYSEVSLLEKNLITKDQLQRFHEFKKNRSDEISENIDDYFETLTPFEKENFIKKLQKIVDNNK
jgi:hypothetical protein